MVQHNNFYKKIKSYTCNTTICSDSKKSSYIVTKYPIKLVSFELNKDYLHLEWFIFYGLLFHGNVASSLGKHDKSCLMVSIIFKFSKSKKDIL